MKPVSLLHKSYSTHYIFYHDSPVIFSLILTHPSETRALFLPFAADNIYIYYASIQILIFALLFLLFSSRSPGLPGALAYQLPVPGASMDLTTQFLAVELP